MADRYFPKGAMGRGIFMLGGILTVRGVFADVDWNEIGEERINNVIIPLTAGSELVPPVARSATGSLTLAVRMVGGGPSLADLQHEVRVVFLQVTFRSVEPASDRVSSQLAPQWLAASLLSGMGLVALTLAALGIGGVVTYLVNQRRRDIGIQIALGASRRRVLGALGAEMSAPILGGVLAGSLASLVLGRAAESFLFGVAPTDLTSLAAGVSVLAGVALFSILVPASRAFRLDPMEALRAE